MLDKAVHEVEPEREHETDESKKHRRPDVSQRRPKGAAIDERMLDETRKGARNNTLFHTLHVWAYLQPRRIDRSAWNKKVLNKAHWINEHYAEPLQLAEVAATAMSVADFCWEKMDDTEFSGHTIEEQKAYEELQAERGRKSGEARRRKADHFDGVEESWTFLGLSRATYYRRRDEYRSEHPGTTGPVPRSYARLRTPDERQAQRENACHRASENRRAERETREREDRVALAITARQRYRKGIRDHSDTQAQGDQPNDPLDRQVNRLLEGVDLDDKVRLTLNQNQQGGAAAPAGETVGETSAPAGTGSGYHPHSSAPGGWKSSTPHPPRRKRPLDTFRDPLPMRDPVRPGGILPGRFRTIRPAQPESTPVDKRDPFRHPQRPRVNRDNDTQDCHPIPDRMDAELKAILEQQAWMDGPDSCRQERHPVGTTMGAEWKAILDLQAWVDGPNSQSELITM